MTRGRFLKLETARDKDVDVPVPFRRTVVLICGPACLNDRYPVITVGQIPGNQVR